MAGRKGMDGYEKKIFADDLHTRARLENHLCDDVGIRRALSRHGNGMCYKALPKEERERRIESICAGCESRCAFGQKWLDLYWAEEDAEWEEAQRRKRRWEAWLKIALKPIQKPAPAKQKRKKRKRCYTKGWLWTAIRPMHKQLGAGRKTRDRRANSKHGKGACAAQSTSPPRQEIAKKGSYEKPLHP